MVWLFFIILFFVALVMWAVSQRRKFARQVGADYERIRRTEPDTALGQMGENEFRLAYEQALKKRSNSVVVPMLLSLPVTLLLPMWMITTSDGSGAQLMFALALCIGGLGLVVRYALSKSPPVVEIMRENAA